MPPRFDKHAKWPGFAAKTTGETIHDHYGRIASWRTCVDCRVLDFETLHRASDEAHDGIEP